MNRSVVQTGIVLALSLTGCTGLSSNRPLPAPSLVQQSSSVEESAELASRWRQEAEELRMFADRHEIEAEVLLQNRSPDVGLIQQRRALARQLRVAAAQLERRAEEAGSYEVSGLVQ